MLFIRETFEFGRRNSTSVDFTKMSIKKHYKEITLYLIEISAKFRLVISYEYNPTANNSNQSYDSCFYRTDISIPIAFEFIYFIDDKMDFISNKIPYLDVPISKI